MFVMKHIYFPNRDDIFALAAGFWYDWTLHTQTSTRIHLHWSDASIALEVERVCFLFSCCKNRRKSVAMCAHHAIYRCTSASIANEVGGGGSSIAFGSILCFRFEHHIWFLFCEFFSVRLFVFCLFFFSVLLLICRQMDIVSHCLF